jgi:glycerol-3-phosphate acyltransferase PlsY
VWVIRTLYGILFPEPPMMDVIDATQRLTALQLAAALAGGGAVIGHNWSVFIGFKGGAGGITSAATTLAISPLVGGMVSLIGILLIWWSRMASVGTFAVGASAFTIFLMLALNQLSPWPYIVYGAIALASVLIALQSNREKLKAQQERVITIW